MMPDEAVSADMVCCNIQEMKETEFVAAV